MKVRELAVQLTRYGGLTVLSACVSIGLPILLHEVARLEERVAVAIALVCAFLLNFLGIRGFVFGKSGGIRGDLARFLGTSIAFRLFEYVGFLLLFGQFGLDYIVALLIPLAISFCLKFITYKLFVFAR